MSNKKVVEARVHTEFVGQTEQRKKQEGLVPDKWSGSALAVDTETTMDQYQSLLFGTYQYCRSSEDKYSLVEEGIFYADDLGPDGVAILEWYCRIHDLKLFKLSKFRKKIFWPAVRAKSFIVGFNLPFDTSRLASASCWSNRRGGGWSFTMGHWKDPNTGESREDTFNPRFVIKPKDGKGAFFHITNSREPRPYPPIRCLDLKTLIWALQNQSHSLESACNSCGVEGKLPDHTPTGKVCLEEIEYNRQDVRATVALLNALRIEFDRHPINLAPDKAYSPASIAKAYLEAMGLDKPSKKFNLSPHHLGIAMQSYYGGRAEVRIRHTQVPVVYTDFLSQYPTVNTLMELWKLLIADNLRIEDATAEVCELLQNLTLKQTFDPKFWIQLRFFAQVQPADDIFPVRTNYAGDNSNIGVNPLQSENSIWYAGPDVVAATLLARKVPKVLQVFRVIPEDPQTGLKSAALRGAVKIDPIDDDFFKKVVEARAEAKENPHLSKEERKALRDSLKVIANAGSYGLFVELNPERTDKSSKTGRTKLNVYSGEHHFTTTSEIVENPGPWYCPIFGSLITAASRLLLAMLERRVTDLGGSYLFCDTDSMGIVASRDGGLVPCVGGDHSLVDGLDEVKALSWKEVERIVDEFAKLNPYDRSIVKCSILKIEDVNFDENGEQVQTYGYAIAAKRYALWIRPSEDELKLVKVSGHGLGYLFPPIRGFDQTLDAPKWVGEAWDWILRGVLQLQREDKFWFERPAMMRFTITTPEVFKALQARNAGHTYADRIKPFNFIVSPVIDRLNDGFPSGVDENKFTVIAAYCSDQEKWCDLNWVNIYDGKVFRLGRPGLRLPYEVKAKTYGDVIRDYQKHPEAKSLAPNETICTSSTAGLLRRTPVTAADKFAFIGKETDRRWEREDDISLIESKVLQYRAEETQRLVADPRLSHKARQTSIRKLAKASNVSEKTVKAFRKGKRVRKSTLRKLQKAMKSTTTSRSQT
jgi:hypothetical protein